MKRRAKIPQRQTRVNKEPISKIPSKAMPRESMNKGGGGEKGRREREEEAKGRRGKGKKRGGREGEMEPVRRDDSGRNVMKEERKEQSRRGGEGSWARENKGYKTDRRKIGKNEK